MNHKTPDPNEADLHAMNILIESAASEQTSIEADAIASTIVEQHLAERQPSDPTEISILWQRDADGRVFTYDFDAVMRLVELFPVLVQDRDTWRRVALAWPWVAAALVFGWALSLWMVSHG